MGAVRNHGNGPSDERFDANYFSIMVLLTSSISGMVHFQLMVEFFDS